MVENKAEKYSLDLLPLSDKDKEHLAQLLNRIIKVLSSSHQDGVFVKEKKTVTKLIYGTIEHSKRKNEISKRILESYEAKGLRFVNYKDADLKPYDYAILVWTNTASSVMGGRYVPMEVELFSYRFNHQEGVVGISYPICSVDPESGEVVFSEISSDNYTNRLLRTNSPVVAVLD